MRGGQCVYCGALGYDVGQGELRWVVTFGQASCPDGEHETLEGAS